LKIAAFNINSINKRVEILLARLRKAEPDVVCPYGQNTHKARMRAHRFVGYLKKDPAPAVLIRLDQPKDAAYTLVEYGDYECPDCGRLYVALRELQSDIASRLVTAR